MSGDLDPMVGAWYRRLDENQLFTVVGIDEDSGLIEIQYFDGDLSEIDTSLWAELELEAAAEPEDWTGPMDDIEKDDLGYSDTEPGAADWRRPLEQLATDEDEDWEGDSDSESGSDDDDEDAGWGDTEEEDD